MKRLSVFFFVYAGCAVLIARETLFINIEREPLTKTFIDIEKKQISSVWVTSMEQLQKQLVAPGSIPGVVCITAGSLPMGMQLSELLSSAQKRLGTRAHMFCVDAENKAVMPFVIQVKNQLRWQHMPLPVFVFFNGSSMLLPAKAGLPSLDQLVELTCHRFNISLR